MAITILSDRIKIGDYSLYEGYNGIYFDGTAAIKNSLVYNQFQGTVSGYTSGGIDLSGVNQNTIDKFPFAADANATDVGDLTARRHRNSGQSSSVSGYNTGGIGSIPAPHGTLTNIIDKFPFATNANATDVGDLTNIRESATGTSSILYGNGYSSLGYIPGGGYLTNIDKFPFATDANAANIGNMTAARIWAAGQSSTYSGYSSGGYVPNVPLRTASNIIDKFPFATNANGTDVGDLTVARGRSAGQSSSISGYSAGGEIPLSIASNVIDKFPFATNANATDVGDLTSSKQVAGAGQSSTMSGYVAGFGTFGSTPPITGIDKFSFAFDANATNVGDLTQARYLSAGQQY